MTLRGAFSSPVYFYYPAIATDRPAPDNWNNADTDVPIRALEIPNRIGKDFRTTLAPLIDQLNKVAPDGGKALFLVRDLMNPDAYGILKWNPASALNDLGVHDCATLDNVKGTQGTFKVGCITVAVQFEPSQRYSKLILGTALLPSDTGAPMTFKMNNVPRGKVAFPTSFGSIALIQEYRYYLRADFEVPGDPTSRLAPVLTRAEYLPSLEIDPVQEDFIEAVDVVDNVFDLQVAVGIDQDYSTTKAGHGVVTDNGTNTDEILFNQPSGFSRQCRAGRPHRAHPSPRLHRARHHPNTSAGSIPSSTSISCASPPFPSRSAPIASSSERASAGSKTPTAALLFNDRTARRSTTTRTANTAGGCCSPWPS